MSDDGRFPKWISEFSDDQQLGLRIKDMSCCKGERQVHLLSDNDFPMRIDPGDAAGLVSGIQIEVGFRTHRFHDLHLGFHALRILFRFRPFGTDLFRTDSENDILVEIILRFGIPLFRKTNGEGVRFEENIFSDLFR